METKGIIFNIQKFSIHDGPGVRTTVFLKGCPLRCKWCANPESQLSRVQIMYDSRKCVHCQTCVHTCPQKAITADRQEFREYVRDERTDSCPQNALTADGQELREHVPAEQTDSRPMTAIATDGQDRIRIDFHRCDGCLRCVEACPGRALSSEGEYKTVDEVVSICMQDRDFYEESHGGVTISGGEGMCQPDFVEELIARLKENHIHAAIETTGHVSEEVFHRLAPLFDLLLFDVKHYSPEKHKDGTGVTNELIIKNLTWAHKQGLHILPRTPVIPGFNDSLEDAGGIAALLKQIGLPRIQLLPFHQMGERKYEFLNRDYTFTGVRALHPEDLTEYQKCFTDADIDCFF